MPYDFEKLKSLKTEGEAEEQPTWNQGMALLKKNSEFMTAAQNKHFAASTDQSGVLLIEVYHALRQAFTITAPYLGEAKKINKEFDELATLLNNAGMKDWKIGGLEYTEIHEAEYGLIFHIYEAQKNAGLGIPGQRRESPHNRLHKAMKVKGGATDDNPRPDEPLGRPAD